jgi:restriction system protein
MTIPSYHEAMLPILKLASDKKEHSLKETIEFLAQKLKLTEEDRKQLLPSGMQTIFDNRVGWARTYLKKAGLLEYSKTGYYKITERGLKVLEQNPQEIDREFLMQFPEFATFQTVQKKSLQQNYIDHQKTLVENLNPVEQLEIAHKKIKDELSNELIDKIKNSSPKFFEELVIALLLKMGYGGSRKDAGEAIGQSGDEGIDGIINEDRLGLDSIYIQAKRWDKGTVSRPEIQKFVGALQGKKASKGIFITTSTFSKEAEDYAKAIACKVILIDGSKLADLMIEYDVGVAKMASYDVKRIDTDFFDV